MPDVAAFAEVTLVVGVVGLVAIVFHHLSRRVAIPAPALFLAASAVAVRVFPGIDAPSHLTTTRLVTVALLLILFDGGMHIGWRRFNEARTPILLLGLLGTFLTVAGVSATTQLVVGAGWYASTLVATAIAPTDPAVVFSVLGDTEISGRSGTIVEGESGANDPVGIALMASLLGAGGLSAGTSSHIAGEFALEMVVGVAGGALGGFVLVFLLGRVAASSGGLYPLYTLASVVALYGLTTIAHGSGFLAVFLAGIVLGDRELPDKTDLVSFHGALAGLAEIGAFVTLGLTVDLDVLGRTDVWLPGIVIAVVVSVGVRPIIGWLCLLPARLQRNETAFVLFAGLKGAVPILLGTYVLTSGVPGADRLYGIIVVVVAFSVVVQGALVPLVARRLALVVS